MGGEVMTKKYAQMNHLKYHVSLKYLKSRAI